MMAAQNKKTLKNYVRFLCELGPPTSYAITDAAQLELSDRWEEALTIKKWIEEMWQEIEKT